MERKLSLTSKENKELEEYCKLNSLKIEEVIKNAYSEGIRIEMYGLLNPEQQSEEVKEKIVEKEVIKYVEVVKEVPKIEYVEVPVEVIKEVEKITEKPIEVIKEVIVEKQQDNSKQKALEATLQKLKTENIEKDRKIKTLEDTISQLKSLQSGQGTYLRGSNLKDKLF